MLTSSLAFYLFIYFWLCWVFVAAWAFLQLWLAGATLQLQSPGSRAHWLQQLWHVGSVVVASRLQSTGSVVGVHKLSCSAACGIFLDHRLNPCLLHWQVDSLPLSHQGSPLSCLLVSFFLSLPPCQGLQRGSLFRHKTQSSLFPSSGFIYVRDCQHFQVERSFSIYKTVMVRKRKPSLLSIQLQWLRVLYKTRIN